MKNTKKILFTACFTAGLFVCSYGQETAEPVSPAASAVVVTRTTEVFAPVPATHAAEGNVTMTAVPAAVTQAALNADYSAAVARAIKDGPAIKQALASLNEAKALLEKEQAASDLRIDAGVFYSESSDKSLLLYQPESEKLLKYRAGLSSRLVTGGELSLNLVSSRMAMLFPAYSGPLDATLFWPSINPYYYPEIMLTYRQPLLRGFLGLPELKKVQAAEYRAKAAKERLKEKVLYKAYEIKKAWYGLYRAGIFQKAAKNYAKDIEAVYAAMKAAGRGEADLLMAKAVSIAAGVHVRTLENDYAAAMENYLTLSGFTEEEKQAAQAAPDEALEDVYIPDEITRDLEETLVSLQPAVAAEKFTALSAEMESSAFEFSAFPQLDLTGSAGFNGVSNSPAGAFTSMGTGKYGDLMIGLDFSWSFLGSAGQGEAGAKKQAHNRAKAVFSEVEGNARSGIRAAYKGVKAGKENYEALKEARLMLEKRVKLLQQAGAFLDLIRGHMDRFEGRKAEAEAFVDFAMAIADWNLVNGKYDFYFNEYVKDNY